MVNTKYSSVQEMPESVKAHIAPYFSNLDRPVFTIRGLPSQMTGALLARYSRAAPDLRTTFANEFIDQETGKILIAKGDALIERVLIAFGDDSVNELEGAHVGLEEISQLATKEPEDKRIGGSPIEQSTRYVKFDKRGSDGRYRYLRLEKIVRHKVTGSELEKLYDQTNDFAFETYSDGIPKLQTHFRAQLPRENFTIQIEREGKKIDTRENELQSDAERRAFNDAYNFTIRCAALDVGRCVLPASSLTQLGIFGNMRYYTGLVTHMKSSELAEFRNLGYQLEEELKKELPTFIKRNREDPEQATIQRNMRLLTGELTRGIVPDVGYVDLLPNAPYLDEVIASCLYPNAQISLRQIYAIVAQLPQDRKMQILETYRGNRKERRDRTGRALEAGYPIVYDLTGGFAEYRDLERMRMLTQQRQAVTTDLGFIIPPEMIEVGLENAVLEVVDRFNYLNSEMKHQGLILESQYATLFNHKLRFMMGLNLREMQHFGELRTGSAGHPSYRAMTQEMVRQLRQRDPWTELVTEFVDFSDPNNKIARAREQSRIAGKSLAKGIIVNDEL